MNNIQPSKTDPKGKAIASFVLGIFTILLVLFLFSVVLGESQTEGNLSPEFLGEIISNPLFWLILVVAPIFGIIFGIQSLKSNKRGFAIVGIILCISGLLIGIRLYFWAF